LRLDGHSKDGSPMKAAHPALANGKACYVGDAVAVVIAETLAQAKDAAEKVVVDYGVLPAVVDPAAAKPGAPQSTTSRRTTPSINWHLGDKAAVDAAFAAAAKHVTKLDLVNNRLVPNAMEPRAAIGEYDSGTEHFTLGTRRARIRMSRGSSRRVRRHRAGAQAARDRARRRRRLRLEDFHLSGERSCAVGGEEASAGR
jgi:carbon-monoxide dehydrogenase large subunit